MKLGDIIQSYRMEHNYSMREFADLCGLSPAQIYFMERGLNSAGDPFTPKVKSLKKVASAMGITFGELVAVCDEKLVIGWDADDMSISQDKQDLIDQIVKATPQQLERLKKAFDLALS